MDNLQDYIYSDDGFFPEEQEMFDKIEKVLGFKLFFWQKTFISRGYFRRYGESTARILRDLLDVNAPALDYTRGPRNAMDQIYRMDLLRMKEKLDAGGIRTRTVLRSPREAREYYKANAAKVTTKNTPTNSRPQLWKN